MPPPKLILLACAITFYVANASTVGGLSLFVPKCRQPSERCSGEKNMPAVEEISCCSGACDTPHPEWGLMCTPRKCRQPEERCAGAENKPDVEWIFCCEGACDTPHPKWGYMCTPKDTAKVEPKCRQPEERCTGDTNRPFVNSLPCCEGSCDTRHPEWGMLCTPKAVVEERLRTCIKEHQECKGGDCCGKGGVGSLGCFADLKSSPDGINNFKMTCEIIPPPPCLSEGEVCITREDITYPFLDIIIGCCGQMTCTAESGSEVKRCK